MTMLATAVDSWQEEHFSVPTLQRTVERVGDGLLGKKSSKHFISSWSRIFPGGCNGLYYLSAASGTARVTGLMISEVPSFSANNTSPEQAHG